MSEHEFFNNESDDVQETENVNTENQAVNNTDDNGCTYHGPANDSRTYTTGFNAYTDADPQQNTYYGSSSNNYAGSYDQYTAAGAQQKEQKRAKRARAKKAPVAMTGTRVVALGLACAIVGGCVGGGGVLLGSRLSGKSSASSNASATTSLVESARTAAVETASYDTTGQSMTAAQVYDANVNSCVGITCSITYNVWGYTTTAAASGSGFIISEDGYIVTNYHVVEDSDTDGITVTMYDGTTYAATLVGYDSDNDVAVLKIDATGLTPVVLGDSDTLAVGDNVIAIGNPLGELTFSLTQGVVSALDREVTLSVGTMNLIQTDTAINSGNSGGPLFNSYGEVIGITNAKYSSSSSSSEASIDNIGFAIPINTVKSIITSIIENGYVVKPYMGVSLQDYSYQTSDGTTVSGAMIYSVVSGEAAEAAGLQRGDLITAIDGNTISSASDATSYVTKCEAGQTITVTIDRNGESMDVSVTLGEKQESANVSSDSSDSSDSSQSQQQSGGSYSMPYGYSDGSGSSGMYGYGYGSNGMNGYGF